MIPLFSKAMNAIAREDIDQLITDKYPEGDNVEYKQTLSTPDGKLDRWIVSGDSIGKDARNKLLEEIIAFANAHGGHLILGIEEATERPARAKNIVPIPHCEDLAERLKLQIRDCIEPLLPVVHVKGIPTAPDGQGVIVFRVPQSRAAPHRVKTTLECCIRHADRCEKMTMREIQDLTLYRDRSLESINAIFDERRRKFEEQLISFGSGTNNKNAFGLRATLIPVGSSLYIERVFNIPSLIPVQEAFDGKIGESPIKLTMPPFTLRSRPILRGVKYENPGDWSKVNIEVLCNCLVEYQLLFPSDPNQARLHPEWFLFMAMNSILTAQRLRNAAGAPSCEYGVESEIRWISGGLSLAHFGGKGRYGDVIGNVEPNPVLFPRLSFGEAGEIHELMKILRRDLSNAAGNEPREDRPITLEIPEEYLE